MRLIKYLLALLLARGSKNQRDEVSGPIVIIEAPTGGFFSVLLGPITPQPDLRLQWLYLEVGDTVQEGELVAEIMEGGRCGPVCRIISPVRGVLRKAIASGNTFVNKGQPLFEVERFQLE